ncbi:WG repeat-containing protein [Alistipes sp.]|uniref:WG repeat-containing protein n=1 Tax=Alistipes sp. TaxID=1872444 RepID=UPI001320E366|nr:WG repeat-containing protein [Alistipes sp.]MUU02757.1 protein kinase [Alistipes sp.]
MFTLRQYLTTLADTHGLTKTLGDMEVCRDNRGRMCYTVGNSAIVFRVRHEGHIRSLRCYMHPPRHLTEIYGERLLPQELYLYDSPRSGVWVDVVLGDWIEGATLHEAVAEAAAAEDTARLRQLAAAFDRLAARLTSDDWAHGDLKPENIVVDSSGRLHLIDFDAMYLPAFAGEASPELGTAAFQHPARTIRDFNASLDDYPAALISTALHALALDPTLYVRYPDADGLLFSPQQIRTDEALREAIALFEREGLAVQYRIARLLYAPTPRLFGLPELLAWAARTGGPPCGGREGEETTGNTGGDKSGDTDGGAERHPAGNTGCGADKHTGGGKSGRELFAGKGGGARNDGSAVFPELFVGNGLWGYRTPERIVIPPLYDSGFDFTEGFAAVRLGQAWHYIDTEGRTRIRCAGYEAVKPFRNGRAKVIRDGRRLEIDRAGREFEILP